MISSRKIPSAVGGKTARACDCCIRKRARWYCTADDAFLCRVCDGSVHSANPLARRHKRVQLKTGSLKRCEAATNNYLVPSWHRGFTRKARTPRHGKLSTANKSGFQSAQNLFPVVPEVGADDNTSHGDDNEERLLYRVPIFDPLVAQLCNSDEGTDAGVVLHGQVEAAAAADDEAHGRDRETNWKGLLACDLDLAEFAADVESLLGNGLEEEACGIEELGLLDSACIAKDDSVQSARVKKEEEEERACHGDAEEIDVMREPFELSFNYDSPTTCEETDTKAAVEFSKASEEEQVIAGGDDSDAKRRKILLSLDYEAVSAAWGIQGSPWMNGERPLINPGDCWPHCILGTCGTVAHDQLLYGEVGVVVGQVPLGDGGREARVSRYREKRRTRLFSKKIRYEVRKLNAEKRPRMKGRFVKRPSSSSAGVPFTLLTK
ncbi:hypothetical protein Nepgr_028070 [Nepenthes gracilis]|uniref:Zinc finger protein CONSTANS-LIKE 16 n=1 Tax=Nepenthes gracilis TaxID=150966 RepID=A0AAD3TB96_NEPGR|nr:hypothetical protein Nepgr_028070 [Nepenthes gracilis]